MIPQAMMASYNAPLRVVDAADFDGTNDYMLRGAGLSGAADSKKVIVSCWVRLDAGGDSTTRVILDNTSGTVSLSISSGNLFDFSVTNAGLSIIGRLITTNTYLAGATWRHVLASLDLATPGAKHFYISDVSDLGASTFTDDTIDYTVANWSIGTLMSSPGTFKMNGALADLYVAPGQYLDFSLVANRRKFISASGKPAHLGADGSLPTGTAPLMYHHIDDGEAVANFATNRGTGGNFSITGTLDTASSSPSD